MAIALSVLATSLSQTACAGLSASEVVVAVNGGSYNSRTLANHFVALRNIPAINVIVLDEVPNSEVISVEEFRTKILRPLLSEIETRKLAGHVQCITYSADFPTAVKLSEDLKALTDLNKVYTPVGSINGLTYLYALVNQGNPSYIGLDVNSYARRKMSAYFEFPGGSTSAEQWAAIKTLQAEKKHAEASQALSELFATQPHQAPLAYEAAAEAALAGDAAEATRLMQASINAGWNAGSYLAADERFAQVREDAEFQVLEYLLNNVPNEVQPLVAFDARTTWTRNGLPTSNSQLGLRFMLSTVLGVTRGQGTTLAEAVEALQRSATADFTHPSGGFYFCLTPDIRTKTRQWGFLGAIEDLKAMGYEAEIVRGKLPMNKAAVLGCQIGTPTFNWASSGSQFVPGALADNLTSLGGVMTTGSSQTKLTEFNKSGAAGSSGTVTEPYSIQEKFPVPQMYVHYARGASLAEAFYLSVTGPYQLLVVGDPLCRPFSNAPSGAIHENLRLLTGRQQLNLELDLAGMDHSTWATDARPRAQRTEKLTPKQMKVLFDGGKPQVRRPQKNLSLNLSRQPPGYHEVTLILITDDPLAQRDESIIPVWLGEPESIRLGFPGLNTLATEGHSRERNAALGQPTWSVSVQAQEGSNQKFDSQGPGTPDPSNTDLSNEQLGSKNGIQVQLDAPGASEIVLWHDHEKVGSTPGSSGAVTVSVEKLGMGPVRLQAEAKLPTGQSARSLPIWLEILP